MIEWTSILVFAGCLIYAGVSDFRTMTIPNWCSVAIAIAYLPLAYAAGIPVTGILIHFGIGIGLFVVGALLFAGGIFGGGDTKLLAAAGIWFGLEYLGAYLVTIALLGGLLALVTLGFRKYWSGRPGGPALLWLNPPEGQAVGIPYGIAIAAAGFLLIPMMVTTG